MPIQNFLVSVEVENRRERKCCKTDESEEQFQ